MKYLIYGLLLGVVGSLPVRAAEFDFKNFEFWANQCVQLSENQNATEAIKACERAIALQPNRANPKLWLARSQALLQSGQYAEALASFDQVLKSSPRSSFALFAQCTALIQLERYDDAIDQCDRALQLNGDWGKASPTLAWIHRGIALRRQGYLETALSSFDRAVFVQSDDAWAKAEQCLLSLELNQSRGCNSTEQAVIGFEQSLVKFPDNPLLWAEQGFALEQLGRYEQALTSYNQAVQLSQNRPSPLARRCGVLNQLEDYKSALESCNQAMQQNRQPQKWQLAYLWTQQGQALLGLGKLEEAIAAADRAIALQPNYPPAFNIKALAYWKQSNYAQANQEIAQAIQGYKEVKKLFQEQFYRDYPETQAIAHRGEIIARFNQGRIYSSQKRYFDAIDAYNTALSLYCTRFAQKCPFPAPINAIRVVIAQSEKLSKSDRRLLASIYTNQSAVFLNIGKYSQAKAWADDSLVLEPNSFSAVYNQALSLSRMANDLKISKKPAEAKEAYQAAVERYSKANELSPNNLYVLIGQADAFEKLYDLLKQEDVAEKLKQLQRAIALYEQILRIDPTSQYAKTKYTTLASSLPALSQTKPIQQPSKKK